MPHNKLLDVARHLIRAGAGQDMYRTLVTRVRRALGRGISTQFFLVYRASNLVLPMAESFDSAKMKLPEAYTQKITTGIVGHVVKEGQTYYASDVSTDPLFHSAGQKLGSELVVPVKYDGEVIGVFNIEADRRDAFSPEVISRVELLCEAAGVLMNSGVAQEQQKALEAQIEGLQAANAIAERRFEALARSLDAAVLVLDPDGKLVFENGAWKGTLKALVGRDFESVLDPASVQAWEKAGDRKARTNITLHVGKKTLKVSATVSAVPVPDGAGGKLVILAEPPAARSRRK